MHSLLQRCFLAASLCSTLAAQQTFAELAKQHLPEPQSDVWVTAKIDFDDDGDTDLLIGRSNQPSVFWQNDGSGKFQHYGSLAALAHIQPISAIAVGDINGDGSDDIIRGTAGNGMQILLGGNFGYWTSPLPLPSHPQFISALCLFDVDGDSDLDLALNGNINGPGGDQLFLNDGSGAFTPATGWLFGGSSQGGVSQFLAFDCDGDGDQDLASVAYSNPVVLYINQGTWMQLTQLPGGINGATSAAAGDVDGDGDIDLMVGHSTSNPSLRQDRLLRNNGVGVFTDDTATAMPVHFNFTSSVHLTDIDGDGDLDALLGHLQTAVGSPNGHALLQNDGTGTFTDISDTLPQNDLTNLNSSTALLIDADGDGDDEYMFSRDTQHLYWNDQGTLVHANRALLPYRGGVTLSVAAGDLDGDGLPELVTGSWNFSILGGRTSLYWNDGTGHMAEAATNPTWPTGFYTSVDLGDIDGDGDLDLVFARETATDLLYRNDGNRVFTDVSTTALPTISDDTHVARFFDADGDGDLDLLCGNTGASRLFSNDGLGNFTEAVGALPTTGGTRDVAIGDVDLDGDLDIVAGIRTSSNQLWLNQNGTFQVAAAQMSNIIQATKAVELADLDGDGDLDLMIGNDHSVSDPRSWMIFNDGTGDFTGTPIVISTGRVHSITAADIEGDGDIDFAICGHNMPTQLFANVGNGSFLSPPGAMTLDTRYANEIAWTDVDGDGDLDLLEGTQSDDRVLTNLHRQLHAEHLLVAGATTTFTASAHSGPAGATPFAALSIGFPATPVATPFGQARLDLATFVPVDVLALPAAQPSAEWHLPIPANAALIGVHIGVQAMIGHDLSPGSWQLSGLAADVIR